MDHGKARGRSDPPRKNETPAQGTSKPVRSLEALFAALKSETNPHARGYAFERALEVLFRRNGFTVTPNARGTAPRQTDLIATHGDSHFLIEAKWRRSPANAGDVDSVRVRIEAHGSGMTGCLFSMSGFTAQAVALVQNKRSPEVLLFGAEEIVGLLSAPVSVLKLIRRKQHSLHHDGVMEICSRDELDEPFKRMRTRQFLIGGRHLSSVVAATVAYGSVHFIDGYYERGPFSLQYIFFPKDFDGLSGAFDSIQRVLGERLEGSFAIHQAARSWFGYGFDELLREGRRWKQRYQQASLRTPHHSEALTFVAGSGDGAIALSARHFIGSPDRIFDAELGMRLTGIPIDLEKYRALASVLNASVPSITAFPSRYEQPVVWLRPAVKLKVVGLITSDEHGDRSDEPDVAGIVAKNPFFRREGLVRRRIGTEPELRQLSETELLVCELRAWHCVGDTTDGYWLARLETGWVGTEFVVHAQADWRTVKCAHGPHRGLERKAALSRYVERSGRP